MTFYKYKIICFTISFLAVLMSPFYCLMAQSVEEYVPFEFELETVYEFSTDFFVDPDYSPPDPASLAFPSQNTVSAGQSLNDKFDLGYLIGIKKDDEVHFISEYKVLVKFACNTNSGNKYTLTQYVTSALTDDSTGESLSEDVLLCKATIEDGEGDPSKGIIGIPSETPVSIIIPQPIYESRDLIGVDLSNTIRVYYWITDQSTAPVTMDQRAGQYKTTIVFTMQEEL